MADSAATGTAPFPQSPRQRALTAAAVAATPLGAVAPRLYAEFDGAELDTVRLQAAVDALLERHGMLRARFDADGSQQITDRRATVEVIDVRDRDETDTERELAAVREARTQADLDHDVLQLATTRIAGGRGRLHLAVDLRAADLSSVGTLLSDLALLYRGTALPPLHRTFADYRDAISDPGAGRREQDRTWWTQQQPQLAEPPALPLVPRSEQTDPRRVTRRARHLDRQTRDGLYAAAERHGVTPAAAIAATLAGSLQRWSTSARMLLACNGFEQDPEIADATGLVGDFTTVAPVDLDLSAADTPAARAAVVAAALDEALAHAAYPGPEVLADLAVARGIAAPAPVVCTALTGGQLFTAEVAEEFGALVWLVTRVPQVQLDTQVLETADGLLVNWSVREDVFRPGSVDAMFAHHVDELQRLAGSWEIDPWEQPNPPAVPEGQYSIRGALNSATMATSGQRLPDGFFRAAAAQPDAVAVISGDGQLSYAGLREQALSVAAALTARGVRPGDTVAVLGGHCAEQIPALLGVLTAAATHLPLRQLDAAGLQLLEQSGVAVVLTCGTLAEQELEPIRGAARPVQVCPVSAAITEGAATAGTVEPPAGGAESVALILFTAGTDGEPLAVELSHDACMNAVEFTNRYFEMRPTDRCLALTSTRHGRSVLDIFATLRSGGAIVLVDDAERADPRTWARLVQAYGVTVLNLPPGSIEQLLRAGHNRLSTLRVVATGGDVVPVDLATRLRREAPQSRFVGFGGTTETGTYATVCEPAIIPSYWTAVPFGRPLPNTACRVVGADGTDCPDWVAGELWIAGRGLADGYPGRPELTTQRFVEDAGRTWFRTGDQARYWPNGTLEFVGRIDRRVPFGGHLLDLTEVESALQRIRGVSGAIVAVLPEDRGAPERLAALVAVDDPEMTPQRVARAVAGFVLSHQVPEVIRLAGGLPYTVDGHRDREAATRLLTEPIPPAG